MKKQVVIIHGGDVHNSHAEYIKSLKAEKMDKEDFLSKPADGWKDTLAQKLGPDYEVFTPEMPNWSSAKYAEWKIWFEKILPFLHEGPVFIGHSLGAIFLAVYFAENADEKKLKELILVAAPYRDLSSKDRLADFVLPAKMDKLKALGTKVHLWFSKDDPIVSFSTFAKYRKALPEANERIFSDKGHFRMKEFPEIVMEIKNAFKK